MKNITYKSSMAPQAGAIETALGNAIESINEQAGTAQVINLQKLKKYE